MGVKQSKRSVDITETATKGEIEGFGNDGKVEKIIDGVVEKMAVNGHVDGDLQNGIEPVQNGVEPLQNGEATATVVTDKMSELKSADESPVEGVVNGVVEANGQANIQADKSDEGKKTEDKKEKKKDNKTKMIKKKFSFKTLSFSKKDKSKPLKEEKPAGKVDETEIETEEAVGNAEVEIPQPVQEELVDETKPQAQPTLSVDDVSVSNETVNEPKVQVKSEGETPTTLMPVEITSTVAEDLPPPLPASPPPSEPVEGTIAADKLDLSGPESTNSSREFQEVKSSLSIILSETNMSMEVLQNAEQIAMETGKQIEEKATNLLKTVEESIRGVEETMSQTMLNSGHTEAEVVEDAKMTEETKEEVVVEEMVTAVVPEVSTLSEKAEEPVEKDDEGAGESLADMPKELTEPTSAAAEVSDPDSLEVSASIPLPPPPVVEPVTGQ